MFSRSQVCVKMRNLANNAEYVWPKDKFRNRLYLMQEMYANFEDDDDWELPEVGAWLRVVSVVISYEWTASETGFNRETISGLFDFSEKIIACLMMYLLLNSST